MKSLKRTLSLVLVLVMILGLVGAASAAFTDDAKIQYKEAVGVMTGIGAIEGMGNNTFNPTGSLTRAQAAKMVAYTLLGADVAKALSGVSTSFKDVTPAFAWAIPSIQYLVSIGAINGRGDGTFDPNGSVTAYEIGKMLLVGLGYGKNEEYIGNEWTLNVAIDANKVGIFAGRLAGANPLDKAANREECALYCFNTITSEKAVLVSYSPLLGGYFPATPPQTIWGNVYPTLVGSAAIVDLYGRPAVGWTYKNKAIVLATDTPIFSDTKAVPAAATLQGLLNKGYTIGATLDICTSGYEQTGIAVAGMTAATILGGNGVVTEVYADDTGVINRIVMINTYLASVAIGAKDNAATTNIDERTLLVTIDGRTHTAYPAKSGTTFAAADGFDAAYTAAAALIAAGKTANFLAVPYLDNTANGSFILSLSVPTTKELTPTAYVAGTNFTAGGTVYTYSAFKLNTVAGFTPVTAVFDNYGYVIAVPGVSAVTNYAVVLQTRAVSGWATTYEAELLMLDGTTQVVSTGTVNAGAFGSDLRNNLVSYTVANNVYTLTSAATYVNQAANALAIKTGIPTFTFNAVTTNVANNNTVFLVKTTDAATTVSTYKAYVGIGAVPSYAAAGTKGAILANAGVAAVVFLDNPTASGATSTDKVFVTGVAQQVVTQAGTYYVAQALVNGEVKIINMAAPYTIGLYTSMTTSSAGIVSLATNAATAITAISAYQLGVITINGTAYGCSSTCLVYSYNATTGALAASSLAAITAGTAGQFVVDPTSGLVVAIFVPAT